MTGLTSNIQTTPNLVFVALTAAISAFLGGLTSIVGMLLFGAYPTLKETADYSGFTQFLYDWQTLAGALIALFAAGITLWAIREQTRSSEQALKEENAASHRIALCALPGSLSDLIYYVEKHWQLLNTLAEIATQPKDTTIDTKLFPSPPSEAIARIAEVARYPAKDKERITQLVTAMCRKVQYHEDRLRTFQGRNWYANKQNITMLLETTAEVQAIATELFQYFDTAYIDSVANENRVLDAAKSLNLMQSTGAGLELLKEKYERRNRRDHQ